MLVQGLRCDIEVRPRYNASAKPAGTIEMMGTVMPFSRNTEIYGEGESAEFIYKVVSGAVRTYKVLMDGRRQIGSFYLPGDIFGLESGEDHTFSAEAIVNSKVLTIKRGHLDAVASRENAVARQVLGAMRGELQRLQDHILLLVKSAQERVAGFLLEMADRSDSHSEIELPMSRQDIADYLGLTIETVSRTLTGMEGASMIALPSARRVVLCDRAALARLNR
jgi:CRP-like cAMP-binding protein